MTETPMYQIAIAGGGLAGLCLAIQAANAGYSVVLFEKEQYPYHKVCGEYISMEAYPFLERLGVPLSQWQLPRISRLTASDVAGRLYPFNLPLGGFGISRYKLDDYLSKLAVEKGVHLLTQTKVTDVQFVSGKCIIKTADRTFMCDVAVGAFGKRSNLDIKWNRGFVHSKAGKLTNYIGIKYHIEYNHPGSEIYLHNFKDGYCGLSKIEDNRSCLCYLTTSANLQQSGNSIAALEKKVLCKNPALKEIFTRARFLYDKPLAISQISFNKKTQVEQHGLMLGDAAGLITPLCGNGMSMAMHSSKLALEAIEPYLLGITNRQQMEKAYQHSWQQAFASRLWMGRAIQQVFGGEKSTSVFLKTMETLPALARLIIRSTHGSPF